jgi:hypothetical protein
MSLQFEYRRLAATCLDLSKRAVALADKTRLLLVAEAWLELAERVSRKRGNVNRRHDGFAEHSVAKSSSTSNAAGPCPPRPQIGLGRIDRGTQ